jgi:uncharacterized protein (DUF2235 family)
VATTYAEPDDVAASWRPLTSAEEDVAQTFLEWTSAKMRKRVPALDARIAANEDDLALLATATAASVVRRALINPEGWREEGIDDYRRVRDAAVSSGALYLSADDVADLMPAVVLTGIYSVPLGGPDAF